MVTRSELRVYRDADESTRSRTQGTGGDVRIMWKDCEPNRRGWITASRSQVRSSLQVSLLCSSAFVIATDSTVSPASKSSQLEVSVTHDILNAILQLVLMNLSYLRLMYIFTYPVIHLRSS